MRYYLFQACNSSPHPFVRQIFCFLVDSNWSTLIVFLLHSQGTGVVLYFNSIYVLLTIMFAGCPLPLVYWKQSTFRQSTVQNNNVLIFSDSFFFSLYLPLWSLLLFIIIFIIEFCFQQMNFDLWLTFSDQTTRLRITQHSN